MSLITSEDGLRRGVGEQTAASASREQVSIDVARRARRARIARRAMREDAARTASASHEAAWSHEAAVHGGTRREQNLSSGH